MSKKISSFPTTPPSPDTRQHPPLNLSMPVVQAARDQMERWLQAVTDTQGRPEISSEMVAAIPVVFAFSNFVSQTCLRNPSLLMELINSGGLLRPYLSGSHGDQLNLWLNQLSGAAPDAPRQMGDLPKDQFEQHLRRYRQREMVRIAFRDLAGWSDLAETLCDLSELADACIQSALSYLEDRYLRKTRPKNIIIPALVVLGMGKLGARELNFSSDVDLIFAFEERANSDSQSDRVMAETVCLSIVRDLVQMLSRNTAEGFVFRVDTRLRPYGDGGPLVMNFDNLENYYQFQGREWERYAMIKARVVAGDLAKGKALLARLRPFVYRRYLDFGVFESLREMKRKVSLEVQRKGMQHHIKLGAGGIREIEFFGQMFQLIRGGVLPDLQERQILKVLQLLSHYQIVPVKVCQTLSEAYIFLRQVENRLQEMEDQQTHLLPTSDDLRPLLALSMGFETWPEFYRQLDHHRKQVHHHFSQLLGEKEGSSDADQHDSQIEKLRILWKEPPESDEICSILKQVGFDAPEDAARALSQFRDHPHTRALSRTGRNRLDRLMPWTLASVGRVSRPQVVLTRILDLFRSIQRRTSYLALLLEYPDALSHLVMLASVSPWIVSFLSRHPVLLDELLDPRTLYRPPSRKMLQEGLPLRLGRVPADDFEHQMEVLRIFKQVNTLRVAASDITNVLPLMNVSDRLSDIAEIILAQVVALSWQHLTQKHGIPECQLAGQPIENGFAVIAYGKLGGLELGYGSDLDLVFLHCAVTGQTQGGPRSIDNAQFFARLGQRVIHILSTHTSAGVLYDVDMRLRPSGAAGVLVSHVDSYRTYQLKDAWTWEHQALIRARAICGSRLLMRRFEEIRREVLVCSAPLKELKDHVVTMREKMRRQHMRPEIDTFDLKQGAGGLVDIEFLVQYLVLSNACQHPQLLDWTDNVRLLQALTEAGLVDELTAYRLRRAYLVYRAVIHRCNLQEQKAHIRTQRFKDLRKWVRRIWEQFLET